MRAMKLPSARLLTCLIIWSVPSLMSETRAPAIGLPLLSRTEPLTVATRPEAMTLCAPAPHTTARTTSIKLLRKLFLIAAKPPSALFCEEQARLLYELRLFRCHRRKVKVKRQKVKGYGF